MRNVLFTGSDICGMFYLLALIFVECSVSLALIYVECSVSLALIYVECSVYWP